MSRLGKTNYLELVAAIAAGGKPGFQQNPISSLDDLRPSQIGDWCGPDPEL